MEHRFERYCKNYENIENYDKALADNFKGWCCHHRLETHNSDGKRRDVDISAEELTSIGMYFDRPAYELVFLPSSEHISLHNKGKSLSEETRNKIAEAKQNISEETRNKMRTAKKGNTNTKGMHWYNNGKQNKYCYKCPPGFVTGMLKIK